MTKHDWQESERTHWADIGDVLVTINLEARNIIFEFGDGEGADITLAKEFPSCIEGAPAAGAPADIEVLKERAEDAASSIFWSHARVFMSFMSTAYDTFSQAAYLDEFARDWAELHESEAA